MTFKLSYFLIFFPVYSCLPECMYVAICVLGACGSQKRAFDPLELEFQIAVSHHVGAWN